MNESDPDGLQWTTTPEHRSETGYYPFDNILPILPQLYQATLLQRFLRGLYLHQDSLQFIVDVFSAVTLASVLNSISSSVTAIHSLSYTTSFETLFQTPFTNSSYHNPKSFEVLRARKTQILNLPDFPTEMTGEDIDEWFMHVLLLWVRETQNTYHQRAPAKQPPPIESPSTSVPRLPRKRSPPPSSIQPQSPFCKHSLVTPQWIRQPELFWIRGLTMATLQQISYAFTWMSWSSTKEATTRFRWMQLLRRSTRLKKSLDQTMTWRSIQL